MHTKLKSTHFRWVIVALLFFITVTNYVDRASISFAIPDMAKLFHFGTKDEGLILGAFGIGYFITTLIGGIAVDRYGPRVILTFAVALWSFSLLLGGFATGFAMIFTARILLGFAEGPNFPAMTRAISDWLPPHERSSSLAYSLLAVPLALAIGGPIVSELILHFNWRGMFIILGIVGLLWLPFWWILFRNFPEQSKHVSDAELVKIHGKELVNRDSFSQIEAINSRKSTKGLWKYLLTNPTLLVNYWGFFVFGYYLFFFMNWLPTYLEKQYNLKLMAVGLLTILPWGLAVILMWIVGHLGDYIQKKTGKFRYSRSHIIWISQLIAGLCIIPIVLAHDLKVAVAFISLAVGFSMCSNAAYYATNIDVIKERAGTALGIMDAGFAISGAIAPSLTGWIVAVSHGSFSSAFILLALLSLSSVILVILFHKPDDAKKLSSLTTR